MKRQAITTYLTFAILLFGVQLISAQQSDYQIKTNFEDRYVELKTAISDAISVSEIDSLETQIDSLEQEFKEHEAMLESALYPRSLEGDVEDLRNAARIAQHRLLIIENQNEKLSRLTDEVSSYESEISNLNTRAESLRQAITTSEDSERQLSDLVQRYRNSLEERDEFILTVIDSILIAYEGLSPQAVSELAEGAETGEISEEENPLQVIHNIVEENIEVLKSSGQTLNTEDYLRMYVVQHRFNEVWEQIGDELVTIYGGNDKSRWESTMDDRLDEWRASSSKNMWDSMDSYLEESNVQLEAFDNNESFYTALENYVKSATGEGKGKMLTSGNYEEYQNFNEFWNGKVKQEWSEFIQEGEVLTMSQITSIDNEMVTWRDEVKPRSLLIPILLGVSLLVIVALIIMLVRTKSS